MPDINQQNVEEKIAAHRTGSGETGKVYCATNRDMKKQNSFAAAAFLHDQ
ncbi:MAG: hypothetical protein JSS06_09695 [Proteobacteria bacterium]|nr:hypothetical protein [Pseudomonadota bacterium]